MLRRANGSGRSPVESVVSAAFSPDGRTAVVGSFAGTVMLVDMASGQVIRRLAGEPNPPVSSVAFSPDGRRVLFGSMGSYAYLLDAATGKEIDEFSGQYAAGHIGGLLT